MRRLLRLLVPLRLILVAPATTAAQGSPPSVASPIATGIIRTLVYRELTTFSTGPNNSGAEAPRLAADGRHLVFAVAPGTENPATPNRIFVMNADAARRIV